MNYRNILKLSMAMLLTAGILSSCSKDDDNNNNNDNTTNVVLSGSISSDMTLSSNTIYELAGKVVVEDGATLTIDAGTIIKGRTGAGSLASALVIARGGKIRAMGTSSNPIVMTSVLDNIKVGEKVGTNLTETDREKWGGLIVLGRAPISAGSGDTEAQIEGIPADEAFGIYGGSNPTDNSGTIQYVSIRHGGALIGEGNEINGLTLGGVGSGTTIDHVEVVANLDDGIECFGGTVNITNLLIAYQGDDAVDLDQNYAGSITNVVVIHGGDTDNGLEIDGPEGTTNTAGLFTISNGTFISTDGAGKAGTFKDKAQGTLSNCLFSGFSSWIRIRANFDDSGNDKTDAYTKMMDTPAKLNFSGNQFETSGTDVVNVYTDNTSYAVTQTMQDNVDAKFYTNNNIVNPNSGTVGANMSEFDGWSWTSIKGKL